MSTDRKALAERLESWRKRLSEGKAVVAWSHRRDLVKDLDAAATALREEGEPGNYYDPVMPLSRFCEAIMAWGRAVEDNVRRARVDGRSHPHGENYADHLTEVFTDIQKSGLLARLLYDGEEIRTEMCPVHEGQMDMSLWMGQGRCPHDCDGTGWLRHPHTEETTDER